MALPTEVSKADIRFKFLMEKFSLADREIITVFVYGSSTHTSSSGRNTRKLISYNQEQK